MAMRSMGEFIFSRDLGLRGALARVAVRTLRRSDDASHG